MNTSEKGLTLVEMLVVLILVTMISILMIQGLGNALKVYHKTSANQVEKLQKSMVYGWMRRVIGSAVPNKIGSQDFIGDSTSLILRSYQPLISNSFVNASVAWRLSSLPPYNIEYTEGDYSFISPLELEEKPSFLFLDENGNWVKEWPKERRSFNLPEAVRITLGKNKYLDISINSHRQPHFYTDEILYGRD